MKDFFTRRVPLPMWAVLVASLLIVVLCGVAASAGGKGSPSTPGTSQAAHVTSTPRATATATHTPAWKTVQSFNGNGAKKTGTFTVGDSWRINWACNPSSAFGGTYNLIVSVYAPDGTPLDYAAINTTCQAGNTSDSTQEHQGGQVYLDINSEGDWTLQVQQLE